MGCILYQKELVCNIIPKIKQKNTKDKKIYIILARPIKKTLSNDSFSILFYSKSLTSQYSSSSMSVKNFSHYDVFFEIKNRACW